MASDRAAARNLLRCHYGKNLIFFPSRKNHCQVVCESLLEADYCLILEFDQCVTKYQCQPEAVNFIESGKTINYTPDFLVNTDEESFYVEIKPDRNSLSPKHEKRLSAAEIQLQQRGEKLLLIDANDIRPPHRLQNLRILYSRSFNVRPEEYTYLVSRVHFLKSHVTLATLLRELPAVSYSAKYLAIFNGVFSFDINRPLTLDSVLRTSP